jgi:uncharacterized membrane protein YkoI
MKKTNTILIVAGVVLAAGGAGTALALQEDGPDQADLDRAAQVALDAVGDGDVTDVEQDDDGTYEVEIRLPDGTETDVDLSSGFEVVRTEADGTDDTDGQPVDDETRTRASDAALAEVGGGTVVSVETDGTGYEVEVRAEDGTETDVDLDADFQVVATEVDDD